MSFVVLTMFVNGIDSRLFLTQFRYDVFGWRVQSHVANRRCLDRRDVVCEQNIGWIRLRICHHRFRILLGLVTHLIDTYKHIHSTNL